MAPEFFDRGGLQRVLSISCHLRTPVDLVIGGVGPDFDKREGNCFGKDPALALPY